MSQTTLKLNDLKDIGGIFQGLRDFGTKECNEPGCAGLNSIYVMIVMTFASCGLSAALLTLELFVLRVYRLYNHLRSSTKDGANVTPPETIPSLLCTRLSSP